MIVRPPEAAGWLGKDSLIIVLRWRRIGPKLRAVPPHHRRTRLEDEGRGEEARPRAKEASI